MSDEKEPIFVICTRASEKPRWHFIQGSVERECAFCHEKVMISPATLQRFDEMPGATILCGVCAMKRVEEMKKTEPSYEPTIMSMSPEQAHEIQHEFMKMEHEEVREELDGERRDPS